MLLMVSLGVVRCLMIVLMGVVIGLWFYLIHFDARIYKNGMWRFACIAACNEARLSRRERAQIILEDPRFMRWGGSRRASGRDEY